MGSTKHTQRGTTHVERVDDAPTDGTASGDLRVARQTLVEAIKQEAPGTDLPRYVAVLDALLAWTGKHTDQLVYKPGKTKGDVLRFERAKSGEVFWSARTARNDAPRLELHLPASRPGSAVDRAEAMRVINAHSREALLEGDRLRIGFGALKNAAALAAVLAMMDRLLAGTVTAPPSPAPTATTQSATDSADSATDSTTDDAAGA